MQAYPEDYIYKPPVPMDFKPPETPQTYSLRGRRLQVIVKLASIELTPEEPKFEGGNWHLEGMRDEAIAATAIYYLANDNVTTPKLHFRQTVREPPHEQYDMGRTREGFGLTPHQPGGLIQNMGHISTLAKRAVAWPNTHQHRVGPMELRDSTKPGSRKFLVFFLVDPAVRVRSTAEVPPQQSGWMLKELQALPRFCDLPDLCLRHILGYTDLLDFPAAAARRASLMAERGRFVKLSNEEWYERSWDLCEH